MSRPSSVSRVSGVSRAIATLVALFTLLVVAVTAGCSSSATKESEKMKDAFDTLLKRPSITQVEADYQSMFQTIQERLSAELGLADWVPDDEPISGSACGGDLSKLTDAVVRRFDAGMSPGNLPDAKWEPAVAIVTEVARQHGFGAPTVIVNRPGDHEVSFRNTFDGELLFGTGANTILGGKTGCHLTEEAHKRGTYLSPNS